MPEGSQASRSVADRREIRAFISSTFRDMEEEREELVKEAQNWFVLTPYVEIKAS